MRVKLSKSILFGAAVIGAMMVMWLRSYSVTDAFDRELARGGSRVVSRAGRIELHWCQIWGMANSRVVWEPDMLNEFESDPRPNIIPPRLTPSDASLDNGFGFAWKRQQVASAGSGIHVRLMAAPYWFVMLVLLAMFGMQPLWGRLRRSRRLSKGMCAGCGYDLRASPGRCPECGGAGHQEIRTSPAI